MQRLAKPHASPGSQRVAQDRCTAIRRGSRRRSALDRLDPGFSTLRPGSLARKSPQKAHVDDDSTQPLNHLRSRARKLGLAIRKQRASRTSSEPLYRLLDRESGVVVRGDLPLVDVSTELLWIVRQRRRAVEQPGSELRAEYCPLCATRRIGYFRYCRTCGRDYEAGPWPEPPPDTRSDVLWLHDATAPGRSSQSAFETVALQRQQAPTTAPASLPLEAPGRLPSSEGRSIKLRRWLRLAGIGVRKRYRDGSQARGS